MDRWRLEEKKERRNGEKVSEGVFFTQGDVMFLSPSHQETPHAFSPTQTRVLSETDW